jgi:hypothetical protein
MAAAKNIAARLAGKAKDKFGQQNEEKAKDEAAKKFFMGKDDKTKKIKKLSESAKRQVAVRREKAIRDGLLGGEPVISMKEVLQQIKMTRYYTYFRDAQVETVEHYARKTDQEVEDLLRTVEKLNDFQIPYAHRVKIFKALRMRWFNDPKRVNTYIDTDALPRIFLAKRDYRQFDTEVAFETIESERQRMICRRNNKGDEEESKRQQFEVRTRHPEHYYELRDVQRCIQEWRAYDPRRMLKEDPREEYFMQRLRGLELRIAASMQEETKRDSKKYTYMSQLRIIRFIFTIMTMWMVAFAWSNGKEGLSYRYVVIRTVTSNHLMAGLTFFMCSQFAYGISTHLKKNVNRARATKMHDATKKLNANIVTFRLESADKRVEKYDETMEGLMDHFGLGEKHLKKIVNQEDLAHQGFDAWFENVMSKPFTKYDVALDLRESYDNLQNDPSVPSHPQERDEQGRPVVDRVGEIEKARKKNAVKTHALAANPSTALQAATEFFDEGKNAAEIEEFENMRKALEKLVKAEIKGADGDSDSSSS